MWIPEIFSTHCVRTSFSIILIRMRQLYPCRLNPHLSGAYYTKADTLNATQGTPPVGSEICVRPNKQSHGKKKIPFNYHNGVKIQLLHVSVVFWLIFLQLGNYIFHMAAELPAKSLPYAPLNSQVVALVTWCWTLYLENCCMSATHSTHW